MTLRAEAAGSTPVLACGEPAAAPVAGFLPRMAYHDEEGAVLAFELIPGARTMGGFPSPRRPFPGTTAPMIEVGRALGRALGTFHRAFGPDGLAGDPRLAWLPRGEPWILSIHKPSPDLLSILSPANYRTLQVLQGRAPRSATGLLDAARQGLAARRGDPRRRQGGQRARPAPRLVRGRGSGSSTGSWSRSATRPGTWPGHSTIIVLLWISSMPTGEGISADWDMTERAGFTRSGRGAGGPIRATWEGYREASAGMTRLTPPDSAEGGGALGGPADPVGLRDGLDGGTALTARAVILAMQVGREPPGRPQARGQVHLYGIPPGSTGR